MSGTFWISFFELFEYLIIYLDVNFVVSLKKNVPEIQPFNTLLCIFVAITTKKQQIQGILVYL